MVDMNVGYELEAGLKYTQASKAKKVARKLGFSVGYDGSVCCNNADEVEFKSPVYKQPKRFLFSIKQPLVDKKLFADFEQISHYVKEINDSMGLHIHLSFNDKKHYDYLFSYEFVKLFQKAYRAHFKRSKERGRIHNNYCRFYDDEYEFAESFEAAIHTKQKTARGFVVNFNAYPIHHTIEFRIFPSTKSVEEFKRYVLFLTNFVNNYISSMEKVRALCR